MTDNYILWAGLGLWVAVTTCVVGDLCLKPLALAWTNRVQRFVFAGVLGLGLWMESVFFTGWIFAYTKIAALVVIGIFSFLAAAHARASFNGVHDARGRVRWVEMDSAGWILAGLSLVTVALGFVAAFAPLVNMNDATSYHLNLPKEFMRLGRVQVLPLDINSAFPLLVDIGYGFGLLFDSPAFANLLAVWICILAAAGVYGWTRERTAPKYAWLAAAAFLLTPAVYNHINAPYVDVALALFTLLSFWAFCGWARTGKWNWLVVSGIFCGFALGVKYFAIIYCFIAAAAIVWEAWRKKLPVKKIVWALGIFAFCAAAVGSVWYLRSWWEMGNPVYPYMSRLFGGKPTYVEWQVAEHTFGVGYSVWNLLVIFWDATFHPVAYAGFGTRWNLLFLGLLPVVLVYVAGRKGGWLAAFAGLILVSWFMIAQVMRFLMPFFPLYCVLLGWACVRVDAMGPVLRRLTWIWILAVCLWETACVSVHLAAPAQVALILKNKREYMLQREPTYATAEWVNANLPLETKIISDAEIRFFYFKPPMVREGVLWLFSNYLKKATDAKDVVAFLKGQGFTHVLIAQRSDDQSTGVAQPLEVRNLVGDTSLFRLVHENMYDGKEEKIRYKLYAIL